MYARKSQGKGKTMKIAQLKAFMATFNPSELPLIKASDAALYVKAQKAAISIIRGHLNK